MISDRDKERFFEYLQQKPVITYACKRAGISNATVHRLRNTDQEFARKLDEAMGYGKHTINDLAESKIMSHVNEGNPWALKYWLSKNHPTYMDKPTFERHEKEQRKSGATSIMEMMEGLKLMYEKYGFKSFSEWLKGDSKDLEDPNDSDTLPPDQKTSS